MKTLSDAIRHAAGKETSLVLDETETAQLVHHVSYRGFMDELLTVQSFMIKDKATKQFLTFPTIQQAWFAWIGYNEAKQEKK